MYKLPNNENLKNQSPETGENKREIGKNDSPATLPPRQDEQTNSNRSVHVKDGPISASLIQFFPDMLHYVTNQLFLPNEIVPISEDGKTFRQKMEYFEDGSLAQQLCQLHERNGQIGFEHTLIKKLMQQLVSQLRFIHELGWAHCDLKCENILYSSKDEKCWLCDWDSVASIPNLKDTVEVSDDVPRGTIEFMSPITLFSCRKVATKISAPNDIWGLGCVMIQMATNNHAWVYVLKGSNLIPIQRMYQIQAAIYNGKKPFIPEKFDEKAKNFLRRIFAENPPTAAELERDPYLVDEAVHEDTASLLDAVFDLPDLAMETRTTTTPTTPERRRPHENVQAEKDEDSCEPAAKRGKKE